MTVSVEQLRLPPLPIAAAEPRTIELQRPKKRTIFLIGTILIVVLVVSCAFFLLSRKNHPAIQSIAVMPFVNESGNADVEYLSDGMTETLIGSLSQLPNLNVKARSSVFRYKGKETSAQTIGKS
jgi:hypothetical protein